MNNLSEKMLERLEKWRKNTQGVPSTEKVRGKQRNYIPRGDYGDDIRNMQPNYDESEQDTKYNR